MPSVVSMDHTHTVTCHKRPQGHAGCRIMMPATEKPSDQTHANLQLRRTAACPARVAGHVVQEVLVANDDAEAGGHLAGDYRGAVEEQAQAARPLPYALFSKLTDAQTRIAELESVISAMRYAEKPIDFERCGPCETEAFASDA